MIGNSAQLTTLVSFGNDFLIKGHLSKDFHLQISTLSRFHLIDFRRMLDKEFVIAKNPADWFKLLKEEGCKKLRLYFTHSTQKNGKDYKLAGFVGGGGTWLVESIHNGFSYYWYGDWEFGSSWKVNFRMYKEKYKTFDILLDLNGIKNKLTKALININNFASDNELHFWSDKFEKALEVLSSKLPFENYSYKDIIPIENYSLAAQQLIASAEKASVFGAMGSWNDLVISNFKGNTKEAKSQNYFKYDELSEQLYDIICRAIVSAVNSYGMKD